jgi:hypothetical protein
MPFLTGQEKMTITILVEIIAILKDLKGHEE